MDLTDPLSAAAVQLINRAEICVLRDLFFGLSRDIAVIAEKEEPPTRAMYLKALSVRVENVLQIVESHSDRAGQAFRDYIREHYDEILDLEESKPLEESES